MSAAGPPAAPAPDLPDKLPGHDSTRKWAADKDTNVPSLKELGYDEVPQTPFKVLLPFSSWPSWFCHTTHLLDPQSLGL